MAVSTHLRKLATLGVTGMAALVAAGAFAADMDGGPAELQLNLQKPVTGIADQIYNLHTGMLIVCLLIFIAVFAAMFYSIFAHRKSKGYKAATFHESTTVEIAWTIVPMIIVIGMAGFATRTVLAMKDTSNADLTIKATGYQWKWGYDYIKGEGEGISFFSNLSTPRAQIDGTQARGINYMLEVDNEVVVPIDKKVRILTTADDVIHAWSVPAFGVKQDAIPGFVRDTWFKADKLGVYRGQCSELCGKEHGFMPIVVRVVSAQDYSKWVDTKKKELAANQDDPNKVWTQPDLAKRGEAVYNKVCAACHQVNGKGTPPAFPPLDGSKTVLGPLDNQIAVELHGRPGTAMAAMGDVLNDTEIAAVVTYTRNAWTNKAQEAMVQPSVVKAARAWDKDKVAKLVARPQ
ncbi:MAG TPA: cytochrome c oxidase subunit II [Burkholderiales bacterium]